MNPLDWVMPPWLRITLKLAPFVVIAILCVALQLTRATLHDLKQQNKVEAAEATALAAQQATQWALDQKTAAETYAKALADRQPIILRSTNEVTRYAQTPAGRAPCSAPDRVQGIDALDASLFAAPSAGRP